MMILKNNNYNNKNKTVITDETLTGEEKKQ